jgi:hypothetical protein
VPTAKGDTLSRYSAAGSWQAGRTVRRDNNVDGDAVMGWVLSMAVVEGLSAEEVAGRLERS